MSETLQPNWTLRRGSGLSWTAKWAVAPIAPNMMKSFDIILSLLQRNLDIYQSYSAKVWGSAADLDALARLETTSSAKWEVAPIAPSMMKNLKNFDIIWSLFGKESGDISNYSAKVWSSEADLDALARLETTSSAKWAVAPEPKHDEEKWQNLIPFADVSRHI